MKIIALLNFYDEIPSWLAATVASTARFCDHIVACDGSYGLYPQGKPSSGIAQHNAITDAAEAVGIGCTLHVPNTRWVGNEVEKRTFLFQAGSLVAEPYEDWFLVIDADELIVEHSNLTKFDLEATDALVAEVTLREKRDYSHLPHGVAQQMPTAELQRARRLYRCIDNMRVETNHYTYVGDVEGEKVYLWNKSTEPALHLPTVVIEHRNHHRLIDRAAAAKTYYTVRDHVGAEKAPVFMEGLDGTLMEIN
jgi:hypothetical protein